jgi:Cu-processing system permease protein
MPFYFISTFCRIAILQGLRSKISWLVVIFALLACAASSLAGAFSARQPLIVAMDVGFSLFHFSLTFLVLVWVQELLQKDQDKKTQLWALAYPTPRSAYLIGKIIGIAFLLGVATLILSTPLWLAGHFSNWGYTGTAQPLFSGWFYASIGAIWLEALVILTFTIFIFSVSTTPFLAIAIGLLFSIATKTMGSAIDFLLYSQDADDALKQHVLPTLKIIRWLLPDLSTLDWCSAVLYQNFSTIFPIPAIAMAIGYILLFTTIATLIFKKRALD